ncbi:MAG: hypothetical protein LBU32_08510 [Clostridiales bacterium]|jgi:hypothetical protein|nr:hypothetical protein [Clostridiales bacterium]
MSIETPFTKEKSQHLPKRTGKRVPQTELNSDAHRNYPYWRRVHPRKLGFREMTYDMDAIIVESTAMKEAINRVGDKFGLPNGWLNTDFKRITSYSDKLFEVSVYYKTFSNIVTVRTIAAEYLIAMKLMSGRRYKNGPMWRGFCGNIGKMGGRLPKMRCGRSGCWRNAALTRQTDLPPARTAQTRISLNYQVQESSYAIKHVDNGKSAAVKSKIAVLIQIAKVFKKVKLCEHIE